jgi:hypothetical protein
MKMNRNIRIILFFSCIALLEGLLNVLLTSALFKIQYPEGALFGQQMKLFSIAEQNVVIYIFRIVLLVPVLSFFILRLLKGWPTFVWSVALSNALAFLSVATCLSLLVPDYDFFWDLEIVNYQSTYFYNYLAFALLSPFIFLPITRRLQRVLDTNYS